MKRNPKALGLAFVAVLAMSAVVATAAQGTNGQQATFWADAYPAVLKGHQENGVAKNYLESTPGRKIHCENATYNATQEEETTELTVTPHYGGCKTTEPDVAATIHLNGCDYTFKATTTHSAEVSTGTASVHCPKGGSITITVGTCVVHVTGETDGWNKDLTGVTFINKGGSTVTVDVNIENQVTTHETDGFLCPFEGNTTPTEGDFKAQVTIHCFEDAGNEAHPTTTGVTTYKPGSPTDCEVK